MGSIKLNDEVVPDRRKNSNRLKLDVADWVKIFITIGTTFAIIIMGWTSIRMTVGQLSIITSQNVKDIAENKAIARDNKKDIEFLCKSFEKIDVKLDKIIEAK